MQTITPLERERKPCNNLSQVSHRHQDRDEIKRRAEAEFLNIAVEFGAKPNKRGWLPCLFHTEKTASAHIYRGLYHCFGCGVSLDVFEFVARRVSTNFKGALSMLADRYGMALHHFTGPERQDFARRREAEKQTRALSAYRAQLLDELDEHRAHLRERRHRCMRFLMTRGHDRRLVAMVDRLDGYNAELEEVNHKIWLMTKMSRADLLTAFRRSGRKVEALDAADEALRPLIVALLAKLQERDEDLPSTHYDRLVSRIA